MWSYEEALEWLYGRQAAGIKLGLDKVRALLAAVGDPHLTPQAIHVAGTNGKGSVCRFLAAGLQRAGHRVGLFTSPHLVSFRERIVVDGEPISEAEVAEHLDRLRPLVEQSPSPPTFFEITFALASLHFQAAGADWVVWETGMGGRLDATNVVEPALTVITNVSLDHAQYLGDSIEAIAGEKAGIMKPGVPLVTSATGIALRVIKQQSQSIQVPISVIGEDYEILPEPGLRLVSPLGDASYRLAAEGEHQRTNGATAVAAFDALRSTGVDIPVPVVHQALAETSIPGRLETIERDGIEHLLDGAHNLEAAQALRWHLGQARIADYHLIVGFSDDKPAAAMLAQWEPLAARVIAVPLRSGRSLDPEQLRRHVSSYRPFHIAQDAAEALDQCRLEGATSVLVAGSLFLVGEARAALLGLPLEEIRGDQ